MAYARHLMRLPRGVKSKAPRLKALAERIRSRHLFVVDVIGLGVATTLALMAWLDASSAIETLSMYMWVVGIVVATRIAVDIAFGLYAVSWRFASIGDMGQILTCTVVGSVFTALLVVAITILGPSSTTGTFPPLFFWLMEMALAFAVLATPRFLIRAASELSASASPRPTLDRTLLYGAGWAGVIVARSAERDHDSGVTPVGFLDDNAGLKGRRVAGLVVYGGIDQLARAKRRSQATSLLITMPRASGETVRNVVDAAMELELDVRTVPPVTDLIDGTLDTSRIRQVRVEDLLRRPPSRDHAPAISTMVTGRTVMVTGAAGSIGSELVRQLLPLDPAHIVLVDQAESALYMLQRGLEDREQVKRGSTTLSAALVDVSNRPAMADLMARAKPVIVFHAAAYKHVPLLEDHAEQAVRVNIGGTMSVVDAAVASDVERFVLVSTDKAVWPSSVMGASKRVAEMIVADAARRSSRPYVSVRFGNVLGSNGSVIPVFQEQLENGQPLTITDPDMTRYFMTIPEAAWLIIDAAALSGNGGLFVLDMGAPVRIMDIADDLARLSGRDPATVPKKIVGLRPGEKLHEDLFYDHEHVAPTEVSKVLQSRPPEPPLDVRDDMISLLAMAKDGRHDQLVSALHDYVKASVAADEGRWHEARSANGETGATETGKGYRPVVAVPVGSNGNGSGNGHHIPDEDAGVYVDPEVASASRGPIKPD